MEDFNGLSKIDDSWEEVDHAIYEFNRKIKKDGWSSPQAYFWLQMEYNRIYAKYGIDCAFNFLYPEIIGPIPDTYEEWREELDKFKPNSKYEPTDDFKQKLIERVGEDRAKKILKRCFGEE